MQPFGQNPDYHDFADRRAFSGIQNFFDVISNGDAKPGAGVFGAGRRQRGGGGVEGVPRSSRGDRLDAVYHDAVFQLARLQGAGECDLGDLPAPRGEAHTAHHRFPAVAIRLHLFHRRSTR